MEEHFIKAKEYYFSYKQTLDTLEDKTCNAALLLQGAMRVLEELYPQLIEKNG